MTVESPAGRNQKTGLKMWFSWTVTICASGVDYLTVELIVLLRGELSNI